MSAHLEPRVLDNGLSVLDTESTHMDLCGTEPTTYTEASSTNNLGTKNWGAGGAFGSPADASPNGRKVASVAITDGAVTASGTAAFLAATDHANSRLNAVYALSSSQVVTNGNTWSCASFDTRIPSQ